MKRLLYIVSALCIGAFVVFLVQEYNHGSDVIRQRDVEATQSGYEAGKNGVPVEACPYSTNPIGGESERAALWRKGWTKGFTERK